MRSDFGRLRSTLLSDGMDGWLCVLAMLLGLICDKFGTNTRAGFRTVTFQQENAHAVAVICCCDFTT